jgi:hypothetical protein
VPGLVYAIPDHEWRDCSNSYLDSQLDEITQGFAEVQRDPFQPGIDVPDSLGNLREAPLRVRPLQQLPRLLTAQL